MRARCSPLKRLEEGVVLVRKVYRKGKVWAEADETGKLVEEHGLVKIRYRQEDQTTYSAKVHELKEVDPNAPPSAPRAAREPRRRVARKKAVPEAAASDAIVIYADGSCFGNPGPAGIGALLEWRGKTKEISEFIGDGTNNIAELTAIEVALRNVKNKQLPVRVHTDSQYSIGVLTEGWKAKENRELIARVQAVMREFSDLQLVKVRGHSGDPRNERVDQLARDAITRRG